MLRFLCCSVPRISGNASFKLYACGELSNIRSGPYSEQSSLDVQCDTCSVSLTFVSYASSGAVTQNSTSAKRAHKMLGEGRLCS